jgi:hypothetical protein
MTNPSIKRDKSTWLLFIVTVFISGLFACANLSEFVTIGILKQTEGYPFRGEGTTPWFYRSAQLYATVNLIFGVLYLISFSIVTWSFVKMKRNALHVSIAFSLLLIVLQLLAGQSD